MVAGGLAVYRFRRSLLLLGFKSRTVNNWMIALAEERAKLTQSFTCDLMASQDSAYCVFHDFLKAMRVFFLLV